MQIKQKWKLTKVTWNETNINASTEWKLAPKNINKLNKTMKFSAMDALPVQNAKTTQIFEQILYAHICWKTNMHIHLHSSQLSLPVEMQRFFLFFVHVSLHVRQNPLLVHVAHPFGHSMHSCRFLSP